ncbi:MAG: NAD(P)-dependent oxidoreductase [Lentisphaerae bacterium]|nr:NAD(P)-dependent oxidoreductase [Lentisphaerota bacterium]
MAVSYIPASSPVTGSARRPRQVTVTGASGRIGRSFCAYARGRYALRLVVRREDQAEDVRAYGEVVAGDLCDTGIADRAVAGSDTVIHLAANASARAEWDSLRRDNIEATYRTFDAAVRAGCRRIVFASSIHAVSGYPPGYQVHEEDPVNPGDLYGVSKCFGEALARYIAVQENVSAIVLRIGSFQTPETAEQAENLPLMNTFLSHRDLNQLIGRCIDDESLRFAVFHALSGNPFNRMDIGTAQELVGYDPEDDFTALNRELADLQLKAVVKPHDERHRD